METTFEPKNKETGGKQRTAREERVAELIQRIRILDEEIAILQGKTEVVQVGLNTETGKISVDELVEANIGLGDRQRIENELPLGVNLVETLKSRIVNDFNDKRVPPVREKARYTILQKLSGKVKRTLLALFVLADFGVGTSFILSRGKGSKATTYDNVGIKDLKDWEKIKLGQDEINKLGNIRVINEANENSDKKYMIVDKSAGMAHLYQGDSLITTYEVGVGEKRGDDQTVTIVEGEKVYWDLGNKQTGAGIYTVNKKGTFEGSPSFTMLNERGIEIPTAFHRAQGSRQQFFNDNNPDNNRMSNGCFNFMAHSLEDLAKQEGFGKGTKVYILPDDPHNKFEIIDGELRFVSNGQNVNRTIRPYEAKMIVLKAEDVNDSGKEFLQTISNNKARLMSMYPTVSNDVFNQLSKVAYGIFGQESSFGTYGMIRGQAGRIADKVGAKLNKNVSAGVTQIRISSVNPKIREAFGIKATKDLFDVQKSAVATLSLLLDIYATNIPNDQKERYVQLVPFYYNNPLGSQKTMKADKKARSLYVKKVLDYSKRVHVFTSVF